MSTTKRIASIDLLRGIAIVGMVLCANIGFNSGLPAWMFHAQTPPPTYAFNPDVPGITWVDLVFPFFLFSMGAAFPLAMRKKLENGQSRGAVAGSLAKRWMILTLFAILLGNAYSIWSTSCPAWQVYIFYIAVWAGLFLSLMRVRKSDGAQGWRKHLGTIINFTGVAMLAALATIFTRHFGITINKSTSDIIIMILAVIALSGGLIWMLTKDNLRLRWLVILFIASIKALDSYAPQALEFIPSCGAVSWFFTYDFLQYLLIALPGSIVGDMLLADREDRNVSNNAVAGGFIALSAAAIQLWGLFTRHVLADFIISAVLAAAYFMLTRKESCTRTKTAYIGFILMLIGIAMDPVDGGITKDHCNLSYLFTTGGMAALTTSFLLMLETRFSVKGTFLAGVGQNPMIAYTVTNFLIGPVLGLLGIMPLMDAIAEGSQFWGMTRGIVMTGLMMGATYICTRFRLFWRS